MLECLPQTEPPRQAPPQTGIHAISDGFIIRQAGRQAGPHPGFSFTAYCSLQKAIRSCQTPGPGCHGSWSVLPLAGRTDPSPHLTWVQTVS